MKLNKNALNIAAFALLIIIMSASMAAPALGQQAQRVKVLISFTHQPGPAEQALVRRAGGTIKYSYHLVPAIAATVPENAIRGLQANPNVIRVEPDVVGHAVDIELDNSWGVKHIGAGGVHDTGNQGAGVKVAIIDSGVDYTHPDLNDSYAGGRNFVEPDGDPMDVYGHGTHVAGTACAEDNDNGTGDLGVVGVAPSCDLYSLRVLDDDGYGYASDTIAAMDWAVDNGIQVANLSLGWDPDPGTAFKAAFDNAWNAGLVIVAAAGNSGNPAGKGNSVTHPAKYESVIAVAATDSSDARASFSSTGDEVELAAPGVAVYSTWNDETGYYDPQPVCGNDANGEYGCYKYGSGTSMASPHVAGTAALVIAGGIVDANDNGRINDEVRLRMQDTADDLGAAGCDPQYGYGLVDADEAAVDAGPVTDIAITAVDGPGSVAQGDTASVDVTVENVGNEDVTDDVNVALTDETGSVNIGTKTISGDLTAGGVTTLTFSWDTSDATIGDHTVTAAHDFSDDDATNDSKSTAVTVTDETAELTVTAIEPNSMPAGTTVDVTITGSGFVDGAAVTFENGSGPAPEASNVIVSEATAITATVTAKGGGPPENRLWDVRVTSPDGSSDVLIDGFTVTP